MSELQRAIQRVKAKAQQYEKHAEGSLKDEDVQSWFRGQVAAANEIITELEGLATSGEGTCECLSKVREHEKRYAQIGDEDAAAVAGSIAQSLERLRLKPDTTTEVVGERECTCSTTVGGDACPVHVYCHGCSEAGGADRAIYHKPPACSATPTTALSGEPQKCLMCGHEKHSLPLYYPCVDNECYCVCVFPEPAAEQNKQDSDL